MKSYYRNVINNPRKIAVYVAKKSKKLPIVLTRNEIKDIINSLQNSKHKLLLSLAYGAGLRVSEVVALKVQDLDLAEMTIHIKSAKGQKDRITILSNKLITDLKKLTA